MPLSHKESRPTWVYYLLCAHYGVLYVGITDNLDRRLGQHQKSKPWWPEVASVEADIFPDRPSARAQEDRVIEATRPPYNAVDMDHGVLIDSRRFFVDAYGNLVELP